LDHSDDVRAVLDVERLVESPVLTQLCHDFGLSPLPAREDHGRVARDRRADDEQQQADAEQ
jgi:hypothetical protein